MLCLFFVLDLLDERWNKNTPCQFFLDGDDDDDDDDKAFMAFVSSRAAQLQMIANLWPNLMKMAGDGSWVKIHTAKIKGMLLLMVQKSQTTTWDGARTPINTGIFSSSSVVSLILGPINSDLKGSTKTNQ